MVIRSKISDVILFSESITGISIISPVGGKYEICASAGKLEFVLGCYNTRQEAQKDLNKICDAYVNGRSSVVVGG